MYLASLKISRHDLATGLSALFSEDPGRITFVPDGSSRCKLVRVVREVRFALAQCTVSNLIDWTSCVHVK